MEKVSETGRPEQIVGRNLGVGGDLKAGDITQKSGWGFSQKNLGKTLDLILRYNLYSRGEKRRETPQSAS